MTCTLFVQRCTMPTATRAVSSGLCSLMQRPVLGESSWGLQQILVERYLFLLVQEIPIYIFIFVLYKGSSRGISD